MASWERLLGQVVQWLAEYDQMVSGEVGHDEVGPAIDVDIAVGEGLRA
jgi:hypothetical protein